MKKLLPLLLFFSAISAQGQIRDLSFSLTTNYPIIGNVSKKDHLIVLESPQSGYSSTSPSFSVQESYNTKAGLNFNFDFKAYQFKSFFIRTGLGVQYYRYQRNITLDQADGLDSFPFELPDGVVIGSGYGSITGIVYERDQNGNIIVGPNGTPNYQIAGSSPDFGETKTMYLQIPVTIGKSFFNNRLIVSTGITSSFLVYASQSKQVYSFTSGFGEYTDKSKKEFNTAMLSGVFETTYLIAKQIGINVSYQRSFTSIYKSDYQYGGKTFYNILSAGVSFHL